MKKSLILIAIAFIISNINSFSKPNSDVITEREAIKDYYHEFVTICKGEGLCERILIDYQQKGWKYFPLEGEVRGSDKKVRIVKYLDTNVTKCVVLPLDSSCVHPEETDKTFRIYPSKKSDLIVKFMDASTGEYVYEKAIPANPEFELPYEKPNKTPEEVKIWVAKNDSQAVEINKDVLNNASNKGVGLFFVFIFNKSGNLLIADKIIRHCNL